MGSSCCHHHAPPAEVARRPEAEVKWWDRDEKKVKELMDANPDFSEVVCLNVRVNVDKLLEVHQLKEIFKAQIFFEATTTVPLDRVEEVGELLRKFAPPEPSSEVPPDLSPEVEDAAGDSGAPTSPKTQTSKTSSRSPSRSPSKPTLTRSPSKVATKAPKKMWSRIAVENMVDPPYGPETKCELDEEKKADGVFVLRWLIVGEFGESLELYNFPFDTQDFTMTLRFGVPVNQGKFLVTFQDSKDKDGKSNSKVVLNVFNLENTWRRPHRMILWTSFTEARSNYKGDIFPLLHVTVQMRRIPWYYCFNIVVPMFMIVFMGACTTYIPYDHVGERLAASLTLVLTAVAYKYIVAQMVPKIGYNTWLDSYVMVCWVFLSLVVLENCLAVNMWHRSEHWMTVMGYILFFVCNAIFAIWAAVVFWTHTTRIDKERAALEAADGSCDSASQSGRSREVSRASASYHEVTDSDSGSGADSSVC